MASWTVPAGEHVTLVSPELRLAEGMHTLELVCDGEISPPAGDPQFRLEGRPYALWVTNVGVGETAAMAASWERAQEREMAGGASSIRR